MCPILHICFNFSNAHLQTQPACRSGIKVAMAEKALGLGSNCDL